MNFGEKLKKICKEEGLNLKEFSVIVEIPYDTISQYSRGRRSPTWEQIHKIANTPQLEKYQQFILSTESGDIDLSEKIDLATLNQKETTIVKYFIEANEQKKDELIKIISDLMERQTTLDNPEE